MDGCPGVSVTPSQNHLTWINSLWNHAQCHVVNPGTGGPSWGLWLQGRAHAEIPAVLCHAREGTGPSPALCPQGSGHLPGEATPSLSVPVPAPAPVTPRGLQSGRGLGPSPLPPTNTSISLLPPPGSGEP